MEPAAPSPAPAPRTEIVAEDKTSTTITYSDGTTRTDQRLPPAPKPAPVTVKTPAVWTQEDLRRLRESSWIRVQAGGKVTERQVSESCLVRSERNASGFDRDRISND
jgi:hypothetical protein